MDTFASHNDAVAEIGRLRERLAALERELARAGTSPSAGVPYDERVGTATVKRESAPSEVISVERDEGVAIRQLEELRDAIARLRAQRARASEEFKNLTRAGSERGPNEPGGATTSTVANAPGVLSPAGASEGRPIGSKTHGAMPEAVSRENETTASVTAGVSGDRRGAWAARPALPGAEQPAAPEAPRAAAARANVFGDPGATSSAQTSPSDIDTGERSGTVADVVPDLLFTGEPPRTRARRWWIAAALIVAIAAVGAWFVVDRAARGGGAAPAPEQPVPGPRETSREPRERDTTTPRETRAARSDQAAAPGVPASPSTSPTQPSTQLSAAIPGASAPLHVEIATTREVWLRVAADGRRVTARLVPGGQTITVDATTQVLVHAGDAGAVRVLVNGRDRGLLGRDGAVVTRTFDRTPQP